MKYFRKSLIIASSLGIAGIASMNLWYMPLLLPKPPIQINRKKGENRNIVVVGAGVIGLTSAYFLSKNPLN